VKTAKAKYALGLVFIAVLPVVWYFWGRSGGKLAALSEGNFTQFTNEFDDPASDQRILLLLSPT